MLLQDYTAASKIDQMSVLVNNAFGITISNYVAQNYGAGFIRRIKKGVKSCLYDSSCRKYLYGNSYT